MKKIIIFIVMLASCFAFVYPMEKDKKLFDPVSVNYEGINLEEVKKLLEKHGESCVLLWYIDENHPNGKFSED